MSTTTNNSINTQATTGTGAVSGSNTWFMAMADAWGKTLDGKADELKLQADKLSAGENNPAVVTQLTALALEMQFLSQSSHTQLTSVGSAMETMARKG